MSHAHHLTLIQGPPGTGKTTMALTLIESHIQRGLLLASAPTNMVADNVARGLHARNVRLARYGGKCSPDLAEISTVSIAEQLDGGQFVVNQKAKKAPQTIRARSYQEWCRGSLWYFN